MKTGPKPHKEGCQLQDLTIVGSQPRPENRRQDGTAQDSGDGDRGMPGDEPVPPGLYSLQQGGEVGDHHLLQVRQQDAAAHPLAMAW